MKAGQLYSELKYFIYGLFLLLLLNELLISSQLLGQLLLFTLGGIFLLITGSYIREITSDGFEKEKILRNMESDFELFRKEMEPRIEDIEFTLSKIRQNKLSLLGIVIIAMFALIAIFAPVLAPPEDPEEPYIMPREGYSSTPQPPDGDYLMGRTDGQYDIYYGVVWGARTAFRVGVLVVGSILLIGLVLGSLAGYYGGWVDELIMRVVDMVIGLPAIVLVIVVATIFGGSLNNVMAALIFAYWPYYARLIRSEILSVREEEYVESSRAVGASDFRIINEHIIPNSSQSLLVMATLDMGTMVIVAAAISFLGLGPAEGFSDWGALLNLSRDYMTEPGYWYTHVFPGLAIFMYVLGWTLLSDAFRDITDPWLRRN